MATSDLDNTLSAILDTMQDVVYSTSLPDRRLLYASASFERVFGYPIEAFLNDPNFFMQVVHPDDLARVIAAMDAALTHGFAEVDHRIIWPDGQVRWLHRRAWINFDDAGRPIRVNDSARDITEQKAAEAKLLETQAILRASEEKYRSVVESSDASITMVTPDGQYLFANQVAAKNFGLTAEEIVKKNVRDLFPPAEAERILFDVQRVIQRNEGLTTEPELKIGAQSIWFRTSIQPVRNAEGKPYAALIHASVVTDKKLAEQELLTQNAIIHQAHDLIALGNLEEGVTFINEGGLRMLGAQTLGEVLGKPLDTFYTHEDAKHLYHVVLPQVMENSYWRGQNRLQRLDGNLVDVDQTIFTIRNRDGKVLMLATIASDISARKQAEDALRQSEAYLRSLVDSDTAFHVRTDMQGNFTYVNKRYRKTFDWLAPEPIGTPSLAMVHPDDHDMVRRAVEQCLAEVGTPVQAELRKPAQGGGYLWTRWEFSAVCDREGVVREIQCVGFDITQQKEAEEALRETNRQLEARVRQRAAELEEERNLLRTVIDAVPDQIYVKDRNGRILLDNSAHARALGFDKPADAVGVDELALLPPDLAAKFRANDRRVLDFGASLINQEGKSIGAGGHEIWALTTKVPLRNLQNEVIGLVGITRDISDLHASEAARHESEELYRTTVSALAEGIVVQSANGAIQLCNAAAEAILGLTREQIMGRTSLDPRWRTLREDGSPFPGEDHPAMVTLRTGQPQHDVVMGVHKPDGELTWISVNTEPILIPGQRQPVAVVASFNDITVQKQAEQALQQALLKEKELGELKSQFVSMASHEFRAPLTTILATTEMLSANRRQMSEAQIDARLEKIRLQVTHMKEIMEDVLQFARTQARRSDFHAIPGDLNAFCRDIVEEFEIDPSHAGRIQFESPDQTLMVTFDARLMRQAISNLLSNALKYSPVTTPVRVQLEVQNDQVMLEVSDEGIGIPPDALNLIFEPFHRAANVKDIAGTGLGLAITKQAVELHGGVITVESEPDRGTTLRVRFPRHPAV